jgi:hypothetical protein
MKRYENGNFVEMTAEEVFEYEKNRIKEVIPYEERVVSRIRTIYSVDDELAILRQRDTKPDEFAEYNRVVEAIKAEERGK